MLYAVHTTTDPIEIDYRIINTETSEISRYKTEINPVNQFNTKNFGVLFGAEATFWSSPFSNRSLGMFVELGSRLGYSNNSSFELGGMMGFFYGFGKVKRN